ncbi:MAG: hypothetical protein PHY73_07235 [Candidatus Omnitrophica bacterium]|nr:hypothetical protein [Candidatus Omnitrophota bacterium]
MKRFLFMFMVFVFLVLFVTICLAQDVQLEIEQEKEVTPLCYSNQDCMRPGVIGICQSPGEKTARCFWQEVAQIPLEIIMPKDCRTCQAEPAIAGMQQIFLGIKPIYLNEDDEKAKDFIKRFKIELLPAYIFTSEVERDPNFEKFQEMSIKDGNYYYVNPQFSGASYFLNRKLKKNQLDLFLSISAPGMFSPLKIAEEIVKNKKNKIKLNLHFLGMKNSDTGVCIAPGGQREMEEEKIYACVDKYYPKKALDYLSCRLLKINSIWFDDCLVQNNIKADKIKKCAQSNEGQKLFEKMIQLSQDLKIRYAPVFLMDNVEIFGVTDQTTSEEIIKTIRSFKDKK